MRCWNFSLSGQHQSLCLIPPPRSHSLHAIPSLTAPSPAHDLIVPDVVQHIDNVQIAGTNYSQLQQLLGEEPTPSSLSVLFVHSHIIASLLVFQKSIPFLSFSLSNHRTSRTFTTTRIMVSAVSHPTPPLSSSRELTVPFVPLQLKRTSSKSPPPTIPPQLPTSDPASHYTLLEKLGTGSFGTVFKAIHNDTRQIVAIKQIDLEDSDDDIGEIQQEIAHLAQCDSEYVTKYYGSFVKGYKLWISECC